VLRWTGTGTEWQEAGGAAESIVGGGAGLIATNPATRDVYRHIGEGGRWERIGGPGAAFAVGGRIVGLSPDRRALMQWEQGTEWRRIGGPSGNVITGTGGIYATHPGSGDVGAWRGPDDWVRYGGPGYAFAAAHTLYGISPDRQAIWRWLGDEQWEQVGGPAEAIAVWQEETVDHLYAIRPGDRSVWYERLTALS
jgi:hypothetical protein